MSRCRYAAEIRDLHAIATRAEPRRWLTYCRRRNILGSSGWHLHDAPIPPIVGAHRGLRIRWRSSSAPDYHEDHPRGPAAHYDDDGPETI